MFLQINWLIRVQPVCHRVSSKPFLAVFTRFIEFEKPRLGLYNSLWQCLSVFTLNASKTIGPGFEPLRARQDKNGCVYNATIFFGALAPDLRRVTVIFQMCTLSAKLLFNLLPGFSLEIRPILWERIIFNGNKMQV